MDKFTLFMPNYCCLFFNSDPTGHETTVLNSSADHLSLPAMAQKKLERFAALSTFSNVLEYPVDMRGKWNVFFKNNHPLVLELACGRGEYTAGLANLFPEQNFIGVDVKGNRMYIGAKKCLTGQIANAGFLRTQIEKLSDYFEKEEVAEIWITFPDPQLRVSKAKKRLTHPRFLRLYAAILKPGGFIHLKTDSPDLYRFTKKVAELYGLSIVVDLGNAYADPGIPEALKIRTHYESLDIAQSKKIHYLKFTLPPTIKNLDDQLQKILRDEEQLD
jgi:tRNA (guanine-N7-)-methyltransferase